VLRPLALPDRPARSLAEGHQACRGNQMCMNMSDAPPQYEVREEMALRIFLLLSLKLGALERRPLHVVWASQYNADGEASPPRPHI
jgi:hypothetical protein